MGTYGCDSQVFPCNLAIQCIQKTSCVTENEKKKSGLVPGVNRVLLVAPMSSEQSDQLHRCCLLSTQLRVLSSPAAPPAHMIETHGHSLSNKMPL